MKAEERGETYALHKASEKLNVYYGNAMLSVVQFDGCDIKNAYIDGYHQAEKDVGLSWEDIEAIDQIFTDVFKDGFDVVTNKYYQEVLNRFNKFKGI